MIGLGQEYPDISQAGGSFLVSATQVLPYMKQIKEVPLPCKSKESSVYLLTKDTIWTTSFRMGKAKGETHNFL